MYYIQLHIDTNIQNIYICTFKYLDISHIYYTYYIILFYLCNTYINIWCLFSRVPTPFSPTVLWSSVAELSLPSSLRDLNQDIFPHRQYFQHQRWQMVLLAKLMDANGVSSKCSKSNLVQAWPSMKHGSIICCHGTFRRPWLQTSATLRILSWNPHSQGPNAVTWLFEIAGRNWSSSLECSDDEYFHSILVPNRDLHTLLRDRQFQHERIHKIASNMIFCCKTAWLTY